MAETNVQDTRSPEQIEAERVMESQLAQEKAGKESKEGKSDSPVEMQSAEFQPVESVPSENSKEKKLGLLMDLTLPVSIELGRTNLMIRDILDLKRGQVVEFEKLASEPVDILVNGKKMAEGEVVVIEKHFGIRITHLVETSERIRGLGK